MQLITPESIREIYKTAPSCHVKCQNCGVPEPRTEGDEFMCCSSCSIMPYCSRTCQVEHWKASHKKTCQKHDATTDQHKVVIRITRKADRLSHQFGPLVSFTCAMQFAIENFSDNSIGLGTHVMMITLSFKETTKTTSKKSGFRIDNLEAMLMTDLSDGHLENVQQGLSFCDRTNPTEEVMVYFLKIPLNGSYLLRPVIQSFRGSPFREFQQQLQEVSTKEGAAGRALVAEGKDGYVQAINDMAQGKRPDLMAVAAKS